MKNQMFNFKFLRTMLIFSVACALALGMNAALAASGPPPIPCVPNLPCIQQETQQSGSSIRDYILGSFGSSFLKGFLGLIAATSVVFIIIGGLQMHLAFGNEEGITTAKKTLLWAIAGLIISILAAMIVSIISSLPYQPPPPPHTTTSIR